MSKHEQETLLCLNMNRRHCCVYTEAGDTAAGVKLMTAYTSVLIYHAYLLYNEIV